MNTAINNFFNDFIQEVEKQEQLNIINKHLKFMIDKNADSQNSDEMLFLLGLISFLEKRYDHALDYFKMIKRYKSLSSYKSVGLGMTYLAKHKYTERTSENDERAECFCLKSINRNPSFIYGYYMMGKYYFHKKNFNEALRYLDHAYSINRRFPLLLNLIGDCHLKLRQFNEAEEKYEESITVYQDIKGNDQFAYPHNGLGNVYREQGEFNKAIKKYKKASSIYKKFSYPRNYLGDCYTILGRYEEAAKEFKDAWLLNNELIFPLYGLGKVAYELGKSQNPDLYFRIAERYFKAVHLKEPEFPYAILDYGRLLARMNRFTEAITWYKLALQKFRNSPAKAFREQEIKTYIKEVINILRLNKNKISDSTSGFMWDTIDQDLETQIFTNKKSFQNFLNEKSEEEGSMDNVLTLEVLRRWNSWTPLVKQSRGGGYFVNAYNKGIVIDPGHSFIENFLESGHKFNEIDLVLLSHSHDDHTANLESILTLLYKYNSTLTKEFIPGRIAKYYNMSKSAVKTVIKQKRTSENQHIQDMYNDQKDKYTRHISAFISEQTDYKFNGLFELNKKKKLEFKSKTLDSSKLYKSINLNKKIDLIPIPASHDDMGVRESLGFVLVTDRIAVIYTGDTTWDNMSDKYEQLLELDQLKGKYRILLAHIGGFHDDERYYNASKSRKYFYEDHLGRIGLTKIIDKINPKICIISEFGQEFSGIRAKLSNILQNHLTKTIFIPADVGFKIDLNPKSGPKVEAIVDIDKYSKYILTDYINVEDVSYGELSQREYIYYFHQKLKNRENEIVGAILSNYPKKKYDNLAPHPFESLNEVLK